MGDSGKVIIFSAPSGAGKTTVVHHLLKVRQDLEFSVSATTRSIRPGEQYGRDYYYLSVEEFRKKVEEDAFVEWEEVYTGLLYGTLKSEVERIWEAGHHVVFDVDVIGGLNLKRIYGEQALDVFIKPPSLEVLEERLRNRKTESEEKLQERIRKARKELSYEAQFSTILQNNDLQETLQKAEQLVNTFIGQ